MAVPYIFSNVPGGTTIPLSELDANFAYCTTSPSLISLSVAGALTVGGSSTFTGLATFNGGITLSGPLTIGSNTVSPNGITGTNLLVFNTSPTLIAPALGTPTQGVLSACTGLPISTGVSGLGAGIANFLAVPTSSNLSAAIIDEYGAGNIVFSNNATLNNPTFNSAVLNTPVSGNLVNCTGYPMGSLVGVLPITQGGTGQTTAAAAANALLPTQSPAVAGYCLITNGLGALSWSPVGVGTVTSIDVSGGTTGLTTTGGPIATSGVITLTGTLNISNGGTGGANRQDAINNLAGGVTSGNYLRGDGTNILLAPIAVADITALGTLSNNTTGSAATFTSVTQNSQFNSIGVGTAPIGTTGVITISSYISTPAVRSFTANSPTAFVDSAGTQVGMLSRAWVYWNSAGIVNSFNVSSVTRNGLGDYTINFTNALPSANYVYTCGAVQYAAGMGPVWPCKSANSPLQTASAFRVLVLDGGSNILEPPYNFASFFV